MPTFQKTRQILEFIRRCTLSNHEAPTIAEIGRHFDLSIGGVYFQLRKMEDKGWITRSRRWRGIQIVGQGQNKAA